MTAGGTEDLRGRLRRALPAAMKAKDPAAVAALRSALAAIDNAEAVDPLPAAPPGPGHPELAGTAAGLGATEVERRRLTQAQIEAIVRAELAERQAAADTYEQARQLEHAQRLRAEATVLRAFLDP